MGAVEGEEKSMHGRNPTLKKQTNSHFPYRDRVMPSFGERKGLGPTWRLPRGFG
jgi:hypothetical protein